MSTFQQSYSIVTLSELSNQNSLSLLLFSPNLIVFLPTELSKKALLHKITLLRRERLAKSKAENACHHPGLEPSSASSAQSVTPSNGDAERNGAKNGELSLLNGVGESDFKQQLIMSTLADIKRSLEDQSVELNELNDSDN